MKDIPVEIINSLASGKVAAIYQDTSIIPLKATLGLLDLLVNEGYTSDNPQITEEATTASVREMKVQDVSRRVEKDSNQSAVKADDVEIPECLWDQLLAPSGNQD